MGFTPRQVVFALILLALTKSLIIALIISPSYGSDGSSYMAYGNAFEQPESEEWRWYIRGTTPVYPMFAYVFYHLGGVYSIVAVQIGLAALVPAALYLAFRPIEARAALLIGLLTTLDPQTALFYQLVATEGLYTLLLGLGIAAFFYAVSAPRPLWIIFLTGILLGIGAFTRPVGTLLLVPYSVFFLLISRSIKRSALLAGGYIAVYLMLSIFNLWRFDFFAPSSANGFYLATRLFTVGGLYDADNGSASARLGELAQACDLTLSDARDENLKTTQDLRLCLIYTHEMKLEDISILYQQVYSESLRANPLIFLETMLQQGLDFITMPSVPYDWEITSTLVTDCEAEYVYDTGWEGQKLFCPAPPRPLAVLDHVYYWTMFAFSGLTVVLHFGLAMVIFPRSTPISRWIVLSCLGLYAYHAVVTAAAGAILSRYVTVTNFYVLIVLGFTSVGLYDRWKDWQQRPHSLKSHH